MMRTHTVTFRAMASLCEVQIAAGSAREAERLAAPAIAEVTRIEQKYSRYRPDSVVSRINAAAGSAPVACDEETLGLLRYAQSLYETSHGLFDITTGILRRAWNFQVPQLPEPDALQALLALTGWPRVRLEGESVFLPERGMELDFGGFGKEYAADCAARVLAQESRVESGYVNLGGDIHVLGPKPDGSPWSFGIRHPREDRLMASMPLQRGALATSGDYERYFELDGRRYCHVLNPRTGMPVGHWRSVSVIAPLALTAGSCTTVAMLMEQEALPFLDSTGFPYLAMDQQGRLHQHSSGNNRS
ncbi:MAG: FAD:protein FMN transferase [Betaproteobacteria bacterium]|nr:FAD:protein FMN transferase [Betaproteobacteria bacterium]